MTRRLAIFSIILALGAASVFIVPTTPVAHASTPIPPIPSSQSSTGAGNTKSAPTASANQTSNQNPVQPPPSNQPSDSALTKIIIWIMEFFAWLVGVAAITLDNAVYYTVVTMGNYVNNLSAVGVAWRILRDVGNIVLIFGFLAIGINTILDTNWYGSGAKMLPTLLIAAVFLNFSLFITEAVIDAGNLFATEFYTEINGGQPAAPTSYFNGGISHEGISNKIMSQLGLQTIYGNTTQAQQKLLQNDHAWLIGFMGILLFVVTAFVLFSLSFILIARFVVLVFLIIIAPVGFAGLAVPRLNKKARQWWGALFDQTITAPILLLLLYIALAVITDSTFLSGFGVQQGSSWTGFTSNADIVGFGSLILSFLVAMGLLLAVTISAKKLSAFGADFATGIGSKLSGASFVAGGVGFAHRYSVGLTANYAAKGLGRTAFGRTVVGRGLVDTLENKVAKASFDVRNTAAGKSVASFGLNLGKGQKGGYIHDYEERVKSLQRASDRMKRPYTAREREDLFAAEERTLNAARAKGHAAATLARVRAGGNQQATAAAETIFNNAETAHKDAEALEQEVKNRVNIAASGENRRRAYARRLSDLYGRVPIVGSAYAEASRKIIGDMGESTELKAIRALSKQVEDSARNPGGGPAAP